jgi:hypothetical protein
MKKLTAHLGFLAVVTGLAWFGATTPALAQESNVAMERLERLEQRVKEMGERQEHFMRELGGQMERLANRGPGGPENLRQPMSPPQGVRPPMLPGGAPPAAKVLKRIGDTVGLLFLIGFICNILMAIWIFTDIRKRGEGSAIFIAMALVAGIPAAVIYALTRLADKKSPAS